MTKHERLTLKTSHPAACCVHCTLHYIVHADNADILYSPSTMQSENQRLRDNLDQYRRELKDEKDNVAKCWDAYNAFKAKYKDLRKTAEILVRNLQASEKKLEAVTLENLVLKSDVNGTERNIILQRDNRLLNESHQQLGEKTKRLLEERIALKKEIPVLNERLETLKNWHSVEAEGQKELVQALKKSLENVTLKQEHEQQQLVNGRNSLMNELGELKKTLQQERLSHTTEKVALETKICELTDTVSSRRTTLDGEQEQTMQLAGDSKILGADQGDQVSVASQEENASDAVVLAFKADIKELKSQLEDARGQLSSGESRHSWEDKFMHLKHFHEVNGHCRVPETYDTDLCRWVGDQRIFFLEDERFKKERVVKLNSLGYSWGKGHPLSKMAGETRHKSKNNSRIDNQDTDDNKDNLVAAETTQTRVSKPKPHKILWSEKFKLLKRFHAANGHCRVPKTYDGVLCSWVGNQRILLREYEGIKKERVDKLNSIGFSWGKDHPLGKLSIATTNESPRPSSSVQNRPETAEASQTDTQFNEDQRITKSDTVDCSTRDKSPETHANNQTTEKSSNQAVASLSKNVTPTGTNTQALSSCAASPNSEDRLEAVRVERELTRKTQRDATAEVDSKRVWTEHFQRLKHFRTETGHCRLPDTHVLHPWVVSQRHEFRSLDDGKFRITLLRSIGFDWGDGHPLRLQQGDGVQPASGTNQSTAKPGLVEFTNTKRPSTDLEIQGRKKRLKVGEISEKKSNDAQTQSCTAM